MRYSIALDRKALARPDDTLTLRRALPTFTSPHCNATLLQRRSHSDCEPGKTFGCMVTDDHHNLASLWVLGGCRGIFRCDSTLRATLPCQHATAGKQQLCPCGNGHVPGSSEARSEGHITVVHGDGMAACAAAINGGVLARHDPRRARVALVWNVSEETRRILSYSWILKPVAPPAGDPRVAGKLPVLGVTEVPLPARRSRSWPASSRVQPAQAGNATVRRLRRAACVAESRAWVLCRVFSAPVLALLTQRRLRSSSEQILGRRSLRPAL